MATTLLAQGPTPNPVLIEAEKQLRESFSEKFHKPPGLTERAMVQYAAGEIMKGRNHWEWVQHGNGTSEPILYEVVFH